MIYCRTVRIFAYSSTREQPNKRSAARLKTESETGETLKLRFTDFEKKTTVLQSDKVKELPYRKLSRSFRERRRKEDEDFETKLNARLAIRQRADLCWANVSADKIRLPQGQSSTERKYCNSS